jgi:hypothetical protein
VHFGYPGRPWTANIFYARIAIHQVNIFRITRERDVNGTVASVEAVGGGRAGLRTVIGVGDRRTQCRCGMMHMSISPCNFR